MTQSETSPVPIHKPADLKPRKRFKWTKRVGATLLLIALAVVIAHVIWGTSAKAELQDEVAAIQARGEPILPRDFNRPLPPSDDNAVTYLRQAEKERRQITAAGALAEAEDDWLQYTPGLSADDWTPQRRARLSRLLPRYARLLDLHLQAAACEQAHWGLTCCSPMINVLLPSLAAQRSIARIVAVRAREDIRQGNSEQGLQRVHAILRQGWAVGRGMHLISALVDLAVEGLAIATLEDVLPELDLSQPGSREQAERLIAELLDESSIRESVKLGFWGERAMIYDTVECLADGRLSLTALQSGGASGGRSLSSTLLTPAMRADAAMMIRDYTAIATATQAESYQDFAGTLPQPPEIDGFVDNLRHVYAGIMYASLDRIPDILFRHIARRRMAAVALAIRLYETDHGKRPARLTDLVPEYLDAVPRDPFSADPDPLKYRPEQGSPSEVDANPFAARPMLYSVGLDGKDDGGVWNPQNDPDVPYDFDSDGVDVPFVLDGESSGDGDGLFYVEEAEEEIARLKSEQSVGERSERPRVPNDDSPTTRP